VSDLPLVRLSKDDQRAICSKTECGFPFAEILRRQDYGMHGLDFLPGWARGGEGLWRMSKRAYANQRSGRGPRVRRVPNPDAPGFSLLRAGRFIRPRIRERRHRPDSPLNQLFTNAFPIEILCPACGLRQMASEDMLGLSGRRASIAPIEESGSAPTRKNQAEEPNHRP